MEEKLPSLEEQTIAEWYVLKRPLSRPNTSWKRAFVSVGSFLAVNFILSSLLSRLLANNFPSPHGMLPLLWFGIACFLVRKKAVVGAVHLYQRYAPEHVRRKCLCKPTCSEYAILAVQKYGVLWGGYKTYLRLFKRCRGSIYRIDEP